MKKIISLSAALVCMLSVSVGCESKKEDFIGKWECDEVFMNGETTDDVFGAPASSLFRIELGDNSLGTFDSFLLFGLNDGKPIDMSWWKSDKNSVECKFMNNAFLNDEPPTYTLTMDDDKLILDMSEDTYEFKAYLKRVDEFTPIPDDTSMHINANINYEASYDLNKK
jgi:hypothetical protein